jgi:hypothetical protein
MVVTSNETTNIVRVSRDNIVQSHSGLIYVDSVSEK